MIELYLCIICCYVLWMIADVLCVAQLTGQLHSSVKLKRVIANLLHQRYFSPNSNLFSHVARVQKTYQAIGR